MANNLFSISLCGLASSYLHPCPLVVPNRSHPCSKCPCSMHVHAKTKKQAIRQAKIETKEIGKACKEHTNKESQLGGKQSMLSI